MINEDGLIQTLYRMRKILVSIHNNTRTGHCETESDIGSNLAWLEEEIGAIKTMIIEEKDSHTREFREINKYMYVRETENFISTLTRKEEYAKGIAYTLIGYNSWTLEVRAKKETMNRTLAIFNEVKPIVNESIDRTWGILNGSEQNSILNEMRMKSYLQVSWEDMEKIKEEATKILDWLHYI
jgi:hypothetical protein